VDVDDGGIEFGCPGGARVRKEGKEGRKVFE